MPYDVIGAVLGLVALIAAGIARQSLNKVAKLEHKLDGLMSQMDELTTAIREDQAARQHKKRKRRPVDD